MSNDARKGPYVAVATSRAVLSREAHAPGTSPAESGCGVLNAAETDRLARLRRRVDRDDFVSARILLRFLLVRVGVQWDEIELRQHCATCGAAHGRPEVVGRPELAVSFAHADGVVAAAAGVAPVGAGGSLGVDIELATDVRRPNLPGFSWRAWTRAEALVKAGRATLDEVDAGTAPTAAQCGLAQTDLDVSTELGPAVGAVVAPAPAIQLELGDLVSLSNRSG